MPPYDGGMYLLTDQNYLMINLEVLFSFPLET